MGSIPLPALQVKTPEQEGVLDQYAKGLGVSNLINQQKLQGQQIQGNQNSLDEEAALKQAMANAGGDVRKAIPEIMKIAPEKGIQLQKSIQEWDKADLETKKSILDIHAKKAERIGQLAGTVTDPESRDLALKAAVEEQLMTPEEAQQKAQEPFDPNAYKNLQIQGMTANQQHNAAIKELDRQDRLAKEKSEATAPTTKEKDFQSFYTPWLEANELPKNAKNEMLARKEYQQQEKTPAAGSTTPEDVEETVQSITEGKASPVLTDYSFRDRTAIAAGLHKKGFDQEAAQRDYRAVSKFMSSMNSNQQLRMQQSITTASEMIPSLRSLYKEWKEVGGAHGLKAFNKADLEASKQLPGRAGEVAHLLDAQIADFTSDLGVVYKGGNSSTDESLGLAKKNLEADWNENTFMRGLDQAERNIGYRKYAILNSTPVGVAPSSPYNPKPAAPATAAPTAAPAGKANDPFGWRK